MMSLFSTVVRKALLTATVLTAAVATPNAQSKTPDFIDLERTIEAELTASKTPGAAVAIVAGCWPMLTCVTRDPAGAKVFFRPGNVINAIGAVFSD